jgi:hypothetical protein
LAKMIEREMKKTPRPTNKFITRFRL